MPKFCFTLLYDTDTIMPISPFATQYYPVKPLHLLPPAVVGHEDKTKTLGGTLSSELL